jgi:hypothetical protein
MSEELLPNCVVHPDDKGQWILYKDCSCQEVIAFFTTQEVAERVQRLLKSEEVMVRRQSIRVKLPK